MTTRPLAAPFAGEPYVGIEPGELASAPFLRFVFDERIRSRFLVEVTGARLGAGYLGVPLSAPIAGEPYAAVPGGGVVLYEETRLFADGRWIGRPGDTVRRNRAADARVIASADIERQLPLAPEAERRGEVAVGEIELANPDGALDDFAGNFSIAGREVVVYLGPANGTSQDFRVIAQLFGQSFETDLNSVRIQVQSTQALLTPSLHQRTYTGAGGIDGDPELTERRVPVLYGECRNITPLLFNRDQWIYVVHDGPILAIDAVKERGLALEASGNDAADYAALRSLTVDAGEYATCLALGMVKVGLGLGGPEGPITMDVRGDKAGSTYVNDIGGILRRVALNRARLDAALISQTDLANLPTGAVGYYASGEQDMTCADLFNVLLRSINGWYGTRRERTLRTGYVVPPERFTAARTYRANDALDLQRVATDQPPRYQQAVTWGKNWTVLAEGDISDGLEDADERLALQLPYNTLRKRSPEVRTRDRTAIDGGLIETYFVNEDDAQEVLDRIMALFRESRRVYRLRLSRNGYLVDLQSIVRLEHPRDGLSSGRNYLVAGVRDDGRRGQVELTLWG